ncbi:hypothetical protein OKW49_008087 [Paraburkholderia youngii]|uniref:hypothetical protein n=1 Tax=Paraburkholderia youngii TaxID=2782701 RepID=UPI003D257E70
MRTPVFTGGVPYLKVAGIVLAGWQGARRSWRLRSATKIVEANVVRLQKRLAWSFGPSVPR